jgi:SAM-dependent methyltransferase
VLTNGSTVFGIDVSMDGALEVMRFACADGCALPFAAGSFDAVALFEVLEHVPPRSEPALLGEAHRVLRQGGTLLLSTPSRHPVGTLLDPAWWLSRHRHYAPAKVRDLLLAAGFRQPAISLTGRMSGALYLPLFCAANRLGRRVPFEDRWRRWIYHEYERPGWHTIVATTFKG